MTERTVLLVGGSGYIGSALARQLAADGQPFVIADIAPSAAFPHAWVACDVLDEQQLGRAMRGIETVVHLAGEHGTEPRPREQFERLNVGGTRAVVAAARHAGVRTIVFTSTAAVYGMPRVPADETTHPAPVSDYGRTKLEAEALLTTWADEDAGRSLVIIRPSVVFGPGIRGNMRALFHRLANPRSPFIGSGRNRKSFAYVDNLAAFHRFALDMPPGTHLFNYADQPDLTMNELGLLIRQALGTPGTPLRTPAWLALTGATILEIRARFTNTPASLTRAQVRRMCASTRFSGAKALAAGFVPPITLADAVTRYARTDLRWSAGVARVVTEREHHAATV